MRLGGWVVSGAQHQHGRCAGSAAFGRVRQRVSLPSTRALPTRVRTSLARPQIASQQTARPRKAVLTEDWNISRCSDDYDGLKTWSLAWLWCLLD